MNKTKMIAITYYLRPESIVETVHGDISASTWLDNERDRILKTPGRIAEVRRKLSRVALFVNDVGTPWAEARKKEYKASCQTR